MKKRPSVLPKHHFTLKDFPGFSAKDLKDLERYYAEQLHGHEAPERRVGWKTAESQRVRFEALTRVAPLKHSKVLDVGCGLGAFSGYLKDQEIPVKYTGVDLFPGVISEAKKIYPDARFEARPILRRPFPARTFDYSFLSGVFNVRVKDNWKYMEALLACVLKQTKKAVAVNVLNAESGLKESDRFMVTPKELVRFGRSLKVKRTYLMDHYHHMDLTLFLYK